ncbi:MAG: hypothetical protein ABIJ57_07260 [Pseudomonadota bacterium]
MTPTTMTDAEWLAWSESVKCRWKSCYAGLGLAGNGTCFAGGDWKREDCPEFKDENEWIKIGEGKG